MAACNLRALSASEIFAVTEFLLEYLRAQNPIQLRILRRRVVATLYELRLQLAEVGVAARPEVARDRLENSDVLKVAERGLVRRASELGALWRERDEEVARPRVWAAASGEGQRAGRRAGETAPE